MGVTDFEKTVCFWPTL